MSEPRGPGDQGASVPLAPILAVNFIGTLGFSIVLPFLVFLVARWGGDALIYGLLGATYSAFQLLGAPVLGRLSDLHGRRKVLLASQLGTLASWAVFLVAFFLPETPVPLSGGATLSLPLVVLFVARAVDGATGGNVSVANAYLADITPEERRSANFGKMAVSSNLGFILGPALAGLLGATVLGEIVPVVAALAISLVASLLIAFRLPESQPCLLLADPEETSVRKVYGHEPKECYRLRSRARLTWDRLRELSGVPGLLAVYFLVMLGFSVFYVAFPMHAVRGLEWSVIDTGIFFSVMGLAMAVVQGPILDRASRRTSEAALTLGGSLVLAAGFACFVGESTPAIYAGAVLIALGNGVMWPSVLSLLSKAAGDVYQGAVQGVAGSAGAVASIAGLVAGGVLYGRLGELAFAVSAGVILVVAAVAALTVRRVPSRPRPVRRSSAA